ncbi:glycosyltransferase family 2 protein [Aggregatibacter actinomycetemcomitans]|uniref:glycosyltransferase family 2 protein n=1 Tax=Aggregatibacter actinomycetemcomitans TaxID=714 RepID=UPI00197B4545|nr:glycosyltransferase family 2 protein [Aggregatibacter actinomycetemcomitans]MBN6077056.1 glycosyltransferase family 2 protein [Aggregatibacter actinomycetemcomitans]MBN6079992.1 glycosyltransferase family 2 protein [Aggregatibacter actinomycetemcomitans]
MSEPILTIVLPCYNEQSVLSKSIPIILNHLLSLINNKKINKNSKLLLIDDGSKDNTWLEIEMLVKQYQQIKALKLTRNFGHQNALLAGMMFSAKQLKTDICITMDCDLQDDPGTLEKMLEKYFSGYEIVYAVRNRRAKDSLFKRNFALLYYNILKKMNINVVPNHADYRLMSARALSALECFRESNLFLRGIVPLLGFSSATVYYEREERIAGFSKYNIPRMMRLAIDGICGFSAIPLLFILWLGIIVSLISLAMGGWALIVKIFGSGIVPGWASTVVPMYFLGGVQLFTLGIIGIYISKIFDEVKDRPKYIIEKEL